MPCFHIARPVSAPDPSMARSTAFAMRTRISCVLLILVLFAVVGPRSADAQTNWWAPVEGPYGGTTVWDLERMPDGAILAATSNGLHRSLDEGQTWSGYSEGLTTFDVRDILVRADGTVWVATFGKGLFRRDGFSSTWLQAGLEDTYATSLQEPAEDILLAGTNGFVYRSEDGGGTWSARSLEGYSVNVQSLAANTTHVFAGTNLGIFRSDDLGATWEFASVGLQEYDARALTTNAEGHVFAGMQPGQGGCAIYRSRGNGSFWTCVQPQTDPLTVPVLKTSPDGTLFAGGFRHLYQSTDEGSTWLSRRAAGSNVQSVLFLGNGLLIGTHGQGVLRSTDGGASWTASSTGMQSAITTVRSLDDGRVVAGTQGGLFATSDLGSTWQRIHPDQPLIQEITDVALDAHGFLLAATKAGLWSYDDEDGWTAMGPPGMPAIRDLHVAADGTILAAYHAGVWLHAGTSWINSPIIGPDLASRDVAAVWQTGGGSLLAGASWDSWRRESGEPTWQLMSSNELSWFDVQAFGETEDRILAGTKFAGVLQSWDDGASWVPLGSGLVGSEDVRDIAFDNRGTPYIATYGSGVYQLNPWTNTWLPIRSGLDGHWRITSMTHDSYGNAWIGTVDGGLFRHGLIGVATEDIPGTDLSLPTAMALGAPYPNPTTGRVHIPVSLPRSAPLRFLVVDMLGRQVSEGTLLATSALDDITIELDALPPGVYLIRLESEDSVASTRVTVIR